MMRKRDLLDFSLAPFRYIANKFGYEIKMELKGEYIQTQRMEYDKCVNTQLQAKYKEKYDYCRYRAFELVTEEIRRNYSDDELRNLNVAEAGVFVGDFAWIINEEFPESKFYLYDTFDGFDESDVKIEIDKGYTKANELTEAVNVFGNQNIPANEKIKIVKSKMVNLKQCVFRKGYFPESASADGDKKWVFVSIDMDLYEPIKQAVKFFYSNLVGGGIYLSMIIIIKIIMV